MGCSSSKSLSKSKQSDILLQKICISEAPIRVIIISEDRSLLFLGDDLGIGFLLSAFSSQAEIIGKLIGHKVSLSKLHF